jgi:hypothetical protein
MSRCVSPSRWSPQAEPAKTKHESGTAADFPSAVPDRSPGHPQSTFVCAGASCPQWRQTRPQDPARSMVDLGRTRTGGGGHPPSAASEECPAYPARPACPATLSEHLATLGHHTVASRPRRRRDADTPRQARFTATRRNRGRNLLSTPVHRPLSSRNARCRARCPQLFPSCPPLCEQACAGRPESVPTLSPGCPQRLVAHPAVANLASPDTEWTSPMGRADWKLSVVSGNMCSNVPTVGGEGEVLRGGGGGRQRYPGR